MTLVVDIYLFEVRVFRLFGNSTHTSAVLFSLQPVRIYLCCAFLSGFDLLWVGVFENGACGVGEVAKHLNVLSLHGRLIPAGSRDCVPKSIFFLRWLFAFRRRSKLKNWGNLVIKNLFSSWNWMNRISHHSGKKRNSFEREIDFSVYSHWGFLSENIIWSVDKKKKQTVEISKCLFLSKEWNQNKIRLHLTRYGLKHSTTLKCSWTFVGMSQWFFLISFWFIFFLKEPKESFLLIPL